MRFGWVPRFAVSSSPSQGYNKRSYKESRMAEKILIVDDERAISETIEYSLSSEGYSVRSCTTGKEALELFAMLIPDLVILDIGLPDQSGFEVCKELRTVSTVPIIFLTARSEEIDRVLGLEIGADDYVVKPFSPRELGARVKAILRRSSRGGAGIKSRKLKAHPFTVDEPRCKISFYDKPLDLTKYELRILMLLTKWPGRVFSRSEIMDRVWESPEMSLERTIDSHIKSLRAKLDDVHAGCEAVVTHRGLGYSLKEEW